MALFVYWLPKLVVVVTPALVPLATPTPIFPSKVTPPVSPLVSTAFISRLLRAVVVPIFPVILASAVPEIISKFFAPSTAPSRVIAPSACLVSIVICSLRSIGPVMVTELSPVVPPV